MSEERKHHDYSPSTLQAREASPCYQPNNNETGASRLGTKQHKSYETGDLSGLTDEQCEAVESCINYSDSVREAMEIRFRDICRAGPSLVKQLDETYLAVDDEETTAGFIDRAYIAPDFSEADLLDCKFGRWPVEPAETNLQGICYLLGLKQKYPSLQRIRVHFMMPYLGVIDTYEFTGDFANLLLRVRVAVARAKQWKADLDAGKQVKWYPTTGTCLFCARQGICEALHGVALKISEKFAPLVLPANFTPSLGGDSAEQGRIRMQLAELMKTWGEATRRQITMRVIDGDAEIPEGYQIIESQKRDEKDPKKIRDIAKDEFGLTQEQIDGASSVALTKLEDAVSDNAPRGTKGDAIEAFRNRLKSAGAVKEGKPFAYLKMIKPDEDGAANNDDNDSK